MAPRFRPRRPFRRTTRRVFRKRSTFRKKKSTISKTAQTTFSRVPRNVNIYPDRFMTKCNVYVDFVSGNDATDILVFKGNSVMNVGPSQGTSYPTGVFASNVPAGLIYILSSPTIGAATGAVAPYGTYRVLGSAISAMYTPNTGSAATEINIFPSDQVSYANLTRTTIAEQPYNKSWSYGNAVQTSQLRRMKNYMSTAKIFGLKNKLMLEDGQFDGFPTVEPARPWFWHIYMTSFDGTATVVKLMRIQITYYIEFFTRNQYASGVPL